METLMKSSTQRGRSREITRGIDTKTIIKIISSKTTRLPSRSARTKRDRRGSTRRGVEKLEKSLLGPYPKTLSWTLTNKVITV